MHGICRVDTTWNFFIIVAEFLFIPAELFTLEADFMTLFNIHRGCARNENSAASRRRTEAV